MTDDQREAIRVALEVLQSAGLAPQGVEAGGEVLAIRDAMITLDARLMEELGYQPLMPEAWAARTIVANAGLLDRIVDAVTAFDRANGRAPTRIGVPREMLRELRISPGRTLLGMTVSETDWHGFWVS